jgi:hypothetical protein
MKPALLPLLALALAAAPLPAGQKMSRTGAGKAPAGATDVPTEDELDPDSPGSRPVSPVLAWAETGASAGAGGAMTQAARAAGAGAAALPGTPPDQILPVAQPAAESPSRRAGEEGWVPFRDGLRPILRNNFFAAAGDDSSGVESPALAGAAGGESPLDLPSGTPSRSTRSESSGSPFFSAAGPGGMPPLDLKALEGLGASDAVAPADGEEELRVPQRIRFQAEAGEQEWSMDELPVAITTAPGAGLAPGLSDRVHIQNTSPDQVLQVRRLVRKAEQPEPPAPAPAAPAPPMAEEAAGFAELEDAGCSLRPGQAIAATLPQGQAAVLDLEVSAGAGFHRLQVSNGGRAVRPARTAQAQ